jgi:chemotaxis response regulator CheB
MRYQPIYATAVAVAQDDQRVEINHVYVMPQNAILSIERDELQTPEHSGPGREF